MVFNIVHNSSHAFSFFLSFFIFRLSSRLIAAICLTQCWHQQLACSPGCTSCTFRSVWVLVGTRRDEGAEGGGARCSCRKKRGGGGEEGVCRKLLLSGSWGFVVLTHQAYSQRIVLLCRPYSETLGRLGPWHINTKRSVQSCNHRDSPLMYSVNNVLILSLPCQ